MTKGVDGIYAKQRPSERDVRRWDLVYEGEIGLLLFRELILIGGIQETMRPQGQI